MATYLSNGNAANLLVILEEANEKYNSNEDHYYSIIFLSGSVLNCLLALF